MKMIPVLGRGNEYLYKPEGSEIIWLSRSKKGFGRKQMSLKTESPAEARTKRDEFFAEWLGEKPFLSKKVKQLAGDLWPIWEKTKSRKSKATQESVKYSSAHLLPMIQNMYAEDINESWWENTYIPTKRFYSPDRKFFNDWKWLTTFLSFLHREGMIQRKPRLTCPDGARAEGLFLSDIEIESLYKNSNPTLCLQIDLGLKHFMRRSEVLLMPWDEIDFETGVINLPAERTKVRKARSIPVNQAVLSLLKARKSISKSPFVFPRRDDDSQPTGRMGNDKAWKLAIARANKEEIKIRARATFHDLRHSGLSRAFMATNRYAEICVMAGLSLEEAQRTYLHIKPEHTRFVADLVTTKKIGVSGNDND